MFREETFAEPGELGTAVGVGCIPRPEWLTFITGGVCVGFSDCVVNVVGNCVCVWNEFQFVKDGWNKDGLNCVVCFDEGGSRGSEFLGEQFRVLVYEVELVGPVVCEGKVYS